MKERGWKQGGAIVHTLKYHEISLSDIISMGKQGTFQLYMHNEQIPETISTNGEFSTPMLHCCSERSVHFKTPRCHGFFQSMFQWLQCNMERLKYSQKARHQMYLKMKGHKKLPEMHRNASCLKKKYGIEMNWGYIPHFEACQISTVMVWRFKKGSKELPNIETS